VVAPLCTYDANKNVTGETTGGVMTSYSWSAEQNEEDRLVGWDQDTGEERDWDLSLVGDWDEFTRDEDGQQGPLLPIVQPRNHTDAHEVDDIDGTPADHDPKGNMTDDGAATGGGIGGSRTFAWDFDNRLTSVTMPDGKVHSFTYDALGRRVSKKVDTGSMGGGPYVETVYICATHESGLGQVVAEYLKGQSATNPERHFVYGRYVDEPLILAREATRRLTGGSELTTRTRFLSSLVYYHRNRKYDIVGLTDASGGVLERYTYTPYGEVTILDPTALIIRTVSAVDNPYAYTGRRWEPETGLYYFRARYYGPKLGRFLGRDPLGYVDGYSLYAGYFGESFALDPSGTAIQFAAAKQLWAIVGAAATVDWLWTKIAGSGGVKMELDDGVGEGFVMGADLYPYNRLVEQSTGGIHYRRYHNYHQRYFTPSPGHKHHDGTQYIGLGKNHGAHFIVTPSKKVKHWDIRLDLEMWEDDNWWEGGNDPMGSYSVTERIDGAGLMKQGKNANLKINLPLRFECSRRTDTFTITYPDESTATKDSCSGLEIGFRVALYARPTYSDTYEVIGHLDAGVGRQYPVYGNPGVAGGRIKEHVGDWFKVWDEDAETAWKVICDD